MQKKILAVAMLVLLVAFCAVACGKDDNIEENPNYQPFEYTTDEAGELYITNVYGDLIPVTTTKDGSMELIEDLVTKTKEQVEKEKQEIENEKNSSNEEPASGDNGGNKGDNGGNQGDNGGNQGGNGIVVGGDDVKNNDSHDAVIVW